MGRGGSPSPLEKQGEPGSPGSDAYEFLKTPHRLVRSQYRGTVWAKEEGSWRDLEICVSPKVGEGGEPLPLPLPGKWGASAPSPPCSYAYARSHLLAVTLRRKMRTSSICVYQTVKRREHIRGLALYTRLLYLYCRCPNMLSCYGTHWDPIYGSPI